MKPTYSKKSKYGSRKVTIDGVTYDSLKEYHRFCDLKLMQRGPESLPDFSDKSSMNCFPRRESTAK